MDIYQFAKDMELEGKVYYQKLAQQTPDLNVRRVFEILADEEEAHYQMLDAFQKKVNTPVINTQFYEAEALFQAYILENITLRDSQTVLEAYGQAVKLEENSIEYYKKMAKQAETASEKAIFIRMHFEEKKHKFLIENIMEILRITEEDSASAEMAKSTTAEEF